MPRTTDSQSYVHFKDNWILSPQGERCVKIRNINNNKYTTMNNLTLVEQKTALTEEFGGKNLVFHVRKNGVSIIENYTIIDRSQSDVKDVFEKFAKVMINLLGRILIVNKATNVDQQSEKLTFTIERDGEIVYTFEATYKEFKKYFTIILATEALASLAKKGLFEDYSIPEEIHNVGMSYDTLALLQRISICAMNISPTNTQFAIEQK